MRLTFSAPFRYTIIKTGEAFYGLALEGTVLHGYDSDGEACSIKLVLVRKGP